MSLSKLTWVVAAGLALCAAAATDARACFVIGPPVERERRPSLTYEQVLILHDAKAAKEHFIREVTFDRADTAIGFIVPTPSRPDVGKLESPFLDLRRDFPFALPKPRDIGFGSGSGIGTAAGVEVLEAKRVGSFTAFVLAADDPKALASWLAQNKLASTPDGDRWLAHYVAMKFYWVAMRYDGEHGRHRVTSETVRISFASPAPYYPYFEPLRPDVPPIPSRLLDLWVISTERVAPVSRFDDGTTRELVRPLREGNATGPSPFPASPLATKLGGLLPGGLVYVQTFQDQKVSRQGFGDILFAPAGALEGDARAARARSLQPLIGILQ